MTIAVFFLRLVVCLGAVPQVAVGLLWIVRLALAEPHSSIAILVAAVVPMAALASAVSACKGDSPTFPRKAVIAFDLALFAIVALIALVLVRKETQDLEALGSMIYLGVVGVPFCSHAIALALLSRLERKEPGSESSSSGTT